MVEEGLELAPRFRESPVLEQALDQDHPRFMIRRVEAEGSPRRLDGRVPLLPLRVEEGDHVVIVRPPGIDRDGPPEVVECLLALPIWAARVPAATSDPFAVGRLRQRGPEAGQRFLTAAELPQCSPPGYPGGAVVGSASRALSSRGNAIRLAALAVSPGMARGFVARAIPRSRAARDASPRSS